MKVTGGKETARNFRQLAMFISVPLNAASRFALQPTLKAARRNVRSLDLEDTTGALAASLTIKRDPKSHKVNPVHKVGPGADFERNGRKPVRYAHLVEFGTAPRSKPGRGSTHPGAAPKPFLTPAFHSTKQEVVKRFGERYGPEMEKRAAKLNKKVT
jgi:HK97 gp10 family phage protein